MGKSKINNKNIYRASLIITFILINVLLLFALGKILGYLNTGAERTGMLHLERETVNTYLPKVNWSSLENPGREMEKQTLGEIENDYLFSWYVKNKALMNNNREGIEDFYTDSARVNLFRLVAHNKENKVHIEGTTLKHNPALEFYSADGQLVVFTDRNIVEYQQIYNDKQLVTKVRDTATYKVMMLLEDGFWRIRHMKRMDKVALEPETTEANPIYTSQNNQILKNGKKFTIKGINYYPKNSPWDLYGDNFNTDTIKADFNIIKNAGLNTIRIFIPYEEFGKADINQSKIEKLQQVLDIAQQKDLAVIVTLFDFYGDYSPETWTLTHRHAEKIVSRFKDHDAILAWDVKNEPDLDFKNRGEDNVTDWLATLIPMIKEWDSEHLVTVGWSNIEVATTLQQEVDFISYHYYDNIDHFEDKLKKLEAKTSKPLVLQEFGISSYTGFWNWFGSDEEDQAEYHKKMQAIFKRKQLAFVSWTLYDFPSVPSRVVGKKPWVRNKQKEFGFIDTDGNKKPSFLYISY
ncbi:cellulase family glycosylhydrolase [Flavobacterium suaedae]|uniref:cellulase family glycosylhydrolase n=1 Tax=Flavobacterium suaedae TaxID=1767027 RepID=UPI001669CADA|nr:cellulase family glycosylhydrolase [Flavobacterium suaedae]